MKIFSENDVNELLVAEIAWAKGEREKLRFSSDGFSPRVTIIGPGGQIAHLPAPWGSRNEMHESMASIAAVARAIDAQAVMLASDWSAMDPHKVAEFLGLPVPEASSPDYTDVFRREYSKVFNGDLLNRDMRNLPSHLWTDCMLAVMKGPNIPATGITAKYSKGAGDVVVWDAQKVEPAVYEFNLLPDYWKIPEDYAAVTRASERAKQFMTDKGL